MYFSKLGFLLKTCIAQLSKLNYTSKQKPKPKNKKTTKQKPPKPKDFQGQNSVECFYFCLQD